MEGKEIIESGSRTPVKTTSNSPAVTGNRNITKGDKAMDMLANNFDKILNLAGSIVELEITIIDNEARLKAMEEYRKQIIDEAQAYAVKKREDTNSVVARMNVIRSMMQDFYAHSQGNLSGDDFCRIITEVVNQMGRVEDGIR